MRQEHLKKLRLKDFQAPNQVLCYGAGLIGRQMVESYKLAGINVVGFIDKNKQGAVETGLGPIPIYSIDAATHTFGKEIIVVITIANPKTYDAITADLTAAGVLETRIFDWGFANWITVPSPKCHCDWMFKNAILLTTSILKCCFWGDRRYFNTETFAAGIPFETSLQSYVEKTRYYHKKALRGEIPLYCVDCPHLVEEPLNEEFPLIESVGFSPSVHCNVKCVYCDAMMETDNSALPYNAKEYGEMFLQMLCYFEENGLLAPGAQISFAGGEISVSPKRKELLEFALMHPEYEYRFLSNCVVYSEEMDQVLAQSSKNAIMCDLDAGTAETYTLIKGYNYFDIVINNLKKYVQSGRVELKYIVLPGFNTAMEDYLGTVKILKELGLSELIISKDHLHHLNVREERKSLFEAARLKMVLMQNGLSGILFPDSYSSEQMSTVEQLYRQLICPPKGDAR